MNSRFQNKAGPVASAFAPYVILTGRRSAFTGDRFLFSSHRNAVGAIAVGLDGPVALATSRDRIEDVLVVAPANTKGRLEAAGRVALLFVDPLKDDIAGIDPRTVDVNTLCRLLLNGPESDAGAFLDTVFKILCVSTRPEPRDDIEKAVYAIGAAPDQFNRLETAAAVAGLSEPRFRHVFADAMGVTFTRYRQWRRMGIVIRRLAEGENLTQAALAAGFASSAHLSAAFRDMFGVSPSDLVSAKPRFVIAP